MRIHLYLTTYVMRVSALKAGKTRVTCMKHMGRLSETYWLLV